MSGDMSHSDTSLIMFPTL